MRVPPASRLPLLVLVGLTLPFGLRGVQTRDLAEATRTLVLDNGLEVIVSPNSPLPLATIEVVLRGGALAQLEPEDEGLPHVLEHMLFKSFDRSGRDWWSERTSEMEATYNGTTGDERVTYYLTLPARNVDEGIKLLADLLRKPRFLDETLTAEKLVVKGELERNASNPYFIADMFADLALWRSAFQRKNAIGNVMTILGVTSDQLERHYERFYVPNNAALIVTGNVEADAVFSSAEAHFERWEERGDPFAGVGSPPIVPLFSDSVFVVSADASDITFTIKWLGPPGAHDVSGTYAASLFTELIDLPTSPTQRRLVDTGLFTVVSAGYQHVNEVSAIVLSARTSPDKFGEASEALRLELDRLADEDYFDADDLASVIKRLRLRRVEVRQTTSGLAHSLANAWAIGGLDYYTGYIGALERQTVEGVRDNLARYVYGRPRVVSMLMSDAVIQDHAAAINDALGKWGTR